MKLVPQSRWERNLLIIFILFNIVYILWTACVVGWRNDHYYFVGIWTVLFFLNDKTRNFFMLFVYCILYWIIYDSMRIFPNYNYNHVRIQEPYDIEKSLFGVFSNGQLVTLNEYFQVHTLPVLDFFTGIFYLSWVPVPFIFCIYLYFKKDRELLLGFILCFLTVNVLGWILYYLYPAAPPWYYAKFGNQFIAETMGDPAGLARFDAIIGKPMFQNMYVKSSSVFAAIPSLHAAFPLILTYFSLKRKNRILTLLFVVILIGIWFSAIYTNHHYVLDVILGIICAILSLIIYEYLIKKSLKKYLIDPILRIT